LFLLQSPLAALSSADFIISTIAEALKVTFQGGEEPKTQLLNFLGELKQAMLLVLDNFEQLAEGADLLAAILQSAPAVKMLVTSRERLSLRDEWLLDIQGLPFPLSPQPDEELTGYSAVQLFLETATRLETTFALSEADKPHLVRSGGNAARPGAGRRLGAGALLPCAHSSMKQPSPQPGPRGGR
jgi:predicted ATPase